MKRLFSIAVLIMFSAAVAYAGTATLNYGPTGSSPMRQTTDGSLNNLPNNTIWDYSAGANGWGITVNHGGLVEGQGTAGTASGGVFTVQGVASMTPFLTNPGTAALWGIGNTGSAVPTASRYNAGNAVSSEPTKATTGNLTGATFDLTGKQVTSPYANRENMVRGSASATGTGATSVIASAGAGIKNYITDVECGRTDAGTTAITVTFSDSASTVMVLPNNGGGGGNNKTFNVPLATAAATAFTFTASAGTTTVFCSAQGFTGY